MHRTSQSKRCVDPNAEPEFEIGCNSSLKRGNTGLFSRTVIAVSNSSLDWVEKTWSGSRESRGPHSCVGTELFDEGAQLVDRDSEERLTTRAPSSSSPTEGGRCPRMIFIHLLVNPPSPTAGQTNQEMASSQCGRFWTPTQWTPLLSSPRDQDFLWKERRRPGWCGAGRVS